MCSATLQDDPSVEAFFNLAETETLALFEHLSFEFLEAFDMFAPAKTGRTREYEPPELMRGFLHCYYKGIYGIRPVNRELQNTIVWLSYGFDRPPSRDMVDCFLTDLEHVVGNVFDHLVKQAARRGLLDLTYCIDSTDVRAMPADQDTSKCYDPTDGKYYYDDGCTIVLTGQKIPITADSQRANKRQKRQRCASHVTRSPSPSRFGWSVTAPTTRLTGMIVCWPQESCQSLHTTRETPTSRKISSIESKTVLTNTVKKFN
jgi:hypothetical protein